MVICFLASSFWSLSAGTCRLMRDDAVERVLRETLVKSGAKNAAVVAWLEDRENVERFLRAEDDNEHKAARRLVSMVAWMEEERPQELYCPACYEFGCRGGDQGLELSSTSAGHYMHVCAYDKENRPTIYSCLELAVNKDIEDNRKHLISTFETAIEIMPPGVLKWNWVLDMHGFRLVDSDPRLARIFLSLAGERYPERLGQFWVVDAPKLFTGLWSIIEKFIDPKTKEKIRFVGTKNGDQELRDALATRFREEDVDWFCLEIAGNRKVKRGEKTFCYREFADQLQAVADERADHGPNEAMRAPANVSTTFLQDIVRHTDGKIPLRMRPWK